MKKLITSIRGLFMAGSLVAKTVKTLPPKEFKNAMDMAGSYLLIDVRTPAELESGKIQGARNVNIRSRTFDQKVQQMDPSRPVFLYCKSGGRSSMAARRLASKGFTQIFDLQGGILAWNRQGMPLKK